MRYFAIILGLLVPISAQSQQRDSVFASYEAYENFVDDLVMKRDFIPLIQVLGGRDEYTKEQLANVNGQMLAAFSQNFFHKTVFHKQDLGGGVMQEARAYWTGESYAFFYAVLHQRDSDVVVLKFNLNSSISVILEKFCRCKTG